MIYLKDIIFSMYGVYDGTIDVNKDSQGKGTLERYNETIASEYDYELGIYIIKMYQAVKSSWGAFTKFLSHLEWENGNDSLYLYSTEVRRRKVLQYIRRYWNIKGTKKFLEVLLGLIGFNLVLTEYFNDYSFDSSVTFDDDGRKWDMKCMPCTNYRLDLVRTNGSTGAVTANELKAILSIVQTNEPIDAKLESIWFNGTKIV